MLRVIASRLEAEHMLPCASAAAMSTPSDQVYASPQRDLEADPAIAASSRSIQRSSQSTDEQHGRLDSKSGGMEGSGAAGVNSHAGAGAAAGSDITALARRDATATATITQADTPASLPQYYPEPPQVPAWRLEQSPLEPVRGKAATPVRRCAQQLIDNTGSTGGFSAAVARTRRHVMERLGREQRNVDKCLSKKPCQPLEPVFTIIETRDVIRRDASGMTLAEVGYIQGDPNEVKRGACKTVEVRGRKAEDIFKIAAGVLNESIFGMSMDVDHVAGTQAVDVTSVWEVPLSDCGHRAEKRYGTRSVLDCIHSGKVPRLLGVDVVMIARYLDRGTCQF